MHVLHFIVINSNDPAEACEEVKCHLLEIIHTDYDCFTVVGCLSESDNFYLVEEAENFSDVSDLNSIQKLNRYCRDNFTLDKYTKSIAVNAMTKYLGKQEVTTDEWYNLKELADYMHKTNSNNIDWDAFDIFKDTFYEHEFGFPGVTHIDDVDEGQKYVIFVDFHV